MSESQRMTLHRGAGTPAEVQAELERLAKEFGRPSPERVADLLIAAINYREYGRRFFVETAVKDLLALAQENAVRATRAMVLDEGAKGSE